MRRPPILIFLVAFLGGTGFGHWGLPARSSARSRATLPGDATPSLASGRSTAAHDRALPAATGPAIDVGPSPTRLRFDHCAVSALRDASGSFTGRTRWVAPAHVLRADHLHVVVVHEWNCVPCLRLLTRLTIEHLGVGVDLVALGIGDDPGLYRPIADLLQLGAGWLYVGGFDEQALLDGVFSRAATPSTLIVSGDGHILAGVQGLPDGDPEGVVRWLHQHLTDLHVPPGRDQPLVSADLDLASDPDCHAATPPPDAAPPVATRPHPPTALDAGTEALAIVSPGPPVPPGAARDAAHDASHDAGPAPSPSPSDATVPSPLTIIPIVPPPPTSPPPLPDLPDTPPTDQVGDKIMQLRKRAIGCGASRPRDVELIFKISPPGYATAVDTNAGTKVDDCIRHILTTIRFPKSHRGATERITLSVK